VAGAHEYRRYRGAAYCHVPADERLVLGRLGEADGDDDRWNRPNERTIYLALDLGVALAEFARHATPGRRRFVRFDVDVPGVADLRSIDPAGLRDRERARDLASRFRADPDCAGLLVPSLAFPDDSSRGCLVLFGDRPPASCPNLLGAPREVGLVDLGDEAGGGAAATDGPETSL